VANRDATGKIVYAALTDITDQALRDAFSAAVVRAVAANLRIDMASIMRRHNGLPPGRRDAPVLRRLPSISSQAAPSA
jgi:hypothetical protein